MELVKRARSARRKTCTGQLQEKIAARLDPPYSWRVRSFVDIAEESAGKISEAIRKPVFEYVQ